MQKIYVPRTVARRLYGYDLDLDRTSLLTQIGFTSSALKTHLLSLGEFVVMYGLVWNSRNWAEQQVGSKLTTFERGLASVRRVLANTSTYMMFDDHDVTDDWFIHGGWKADVLAKPAGKRIIANAMVAYFLFQGWGNAPEKFNFRAIKELIESPPERQGGFGYDEYFLRLDWEFAVPTVPVSYFLDTRTKRTGHGFPVTLKGNWSETVIPVQNKNMPFILIAPGPLVTFTMIDAIQSAASKLPETEYTGKFGADFESWFSNFQNYSDLFEKCRRESLSKVVVLSGDVHYGFSAVFAIYNKEYLFGAGGGHRLNGLQLTSSALNNSAGALRYIARQVYSGKLYFLWFAAGEVSLATEKRAAVSLAMDMKSNMMLFGAPMVLLHPPMYCLEGNQLFVLDTEWLLGDPYVLLAVEKYPKLVVEVSVNLPVPRTAGYVGEHNFGIVSIHHNSVEYSFNGGAKYDHNL